MRELDLPIRLRTDSSNRSTPPRMTVWESGSPSVALLLRVIMAACGRCQITVRELHFRFLSRADQRVGRAIEFAPVAYLPCLMRHEISMAFHSPQLISKATLIPKCNGLAPSRRAYSHHGA